MGQREWVFSNLSVEWLRSSSEKGLTAEVRPSSYCETNSLIRCLLSSVEEFHLFWSIYANGDRELGYFDNHSGS